MYSAREPAVTWGYTTEAELVKAGARQLARTAAELEEWVKASKA